MNLTRLPRLVVSAAAAVTLTGCYTLESNITIGSDGTADIELVALINVDSMRELAEMTGEDISDLSDMDADEMLEEMTGDNPCDTSDFDGFDVTTEEVRTGEEIGVRCTVHDIPLAELVSLGFDDTGDSTLAITQTGTRTTFEMSIPGFDQAAGETGIPGFRFEDLFDLSVSVAAPGGLVDHNATSVDGSRARWQITVDSPYIDADGTARMRAEWDTTESTRAPMWAVWVAAVLLGVAAVGGVTWFVRRRRLPGTYNSHTQTGPTVDSPWAPPAQTPPRDNPWNP